MERVRRILMPLIIPILLGSFLFCGSGKEVKASGTEDTITLPIDGILCHQQAGELFDGINEERAKRGIHELIWDSGYEEIARIRAIETSVYFSHLLPSAEEEVNIGVGKYNRSVVAECLTCGSLDTGRALLNWMEEPGHRSSVLGEWKYAACGVFGIMRPDGRKVEYYFVFIAGSDPITGIKSRETGNERVSGYPVILAHPEERITGISIDGIINSSGAYVDCYYLDTVTILASLNIRSSGPGGIHINQIPVTPDTFLIWPKDSAKASVSGLNMTAFSAGDADIDISLREKQSIGGTVRIEVLKRHAVWDWIRQINSSFPKGRMPQASDFSVKDDLGNTLTVGRDYDMTCRREGSSGYVEACFSFRENYKGTVYKTIAFPASDPDDGSASSTPETAGTGEGESGSGSSDNNVGAVTPPAHPAGAQQNMSRETGSSLINHTGIGENNTAVLSRKAAAFTVSKKNTEPQVSDVTVRSDLKMPKLRSVKFSKNGLLRISWKKDKKMLRKADGCEIQISPDKCFESAVMTILIRKNNASCRIKARGQKRLFVRIRYFSSGGVSAWSKTKKARIK